MASSLFFKERHYQGMQKEQMEELRMIIDAGKSNRKGDLEQNPVKIEEYRRLLDDKDGFVDGKKVTYALHRGLSKATEQARSYVECFIVIRGTAVILIDGKKVVLEKQEMVFINRHSALEIQTSGEEDYILRIAILPEFLDNFRSLAGEEDIPTEFLLSELLDEDKKGEYLQLRSADSMQIRVLLDNMMRAVQSDDQDPSRFNHTVTAMILFYLLDNLPHALTRQPSRYENLIAMTVLQYIEENYRTGTLTELCLMLHLPMHALSRMIKKTLGYNFKEILQQKCLVKAVMLLCDTDLPINEIVQAVGYENNSYFHKVFRDKYGTTPRVFRGRYSKNRVIRLQV